MAELPFAAPAPEEEIPALPALPPQGSGVKRAVIALCAIGLTLGLAGLVLFGTRAAHRMGKRAVPTAAEAAPRAGNVGDPLKGLQTDYKALLAQPAQPPPPQGPIAQHQAVAPTQGPSARPTPQKKDEGMLVLEGKHAAAQRQPATPKYSQELPQMPQGDGAKGEQTPQGTVERQRAWLEQAKGLRETKVNDTLHTPESPWMILAGDIIPASLVMGIQSNNPGELVARVRLEVRDSVEGRTVLIPQGAMLIGAYNNDVVYGQDRVLVAWHRLRLPNGQTIQLEGMPGIDLSGYAGLKDKVNNHLWPLFRAVLLSSVLSVGTRVPFGSQSGYAQNLSQEFAQDFAAGANQAGQMIIRRELQRPPTVTIRQGMSFNVFVLKDLVLMPYTGVVAYGG